MDYFRNPHEDVELEFPSTDPLAICDNIKVEEASHISATNQTQMSIKLEGGSNEVLYRLTDEIEIGESKLMESIVYDEPNEEMKEAIQTCIENSHRDPLQLNDTFNTASSKPFQPSAFQSLTVTVSSTPTSNVRPSFDNSAVVIDSISQLKQIHRTLQIEAPAVQHPAHAVQQAAPVLQYVTTAKHQSSSSERPLPPKRQGPTVQRASESFTRQQYKDIMNKLDTNHTILSHLLTEMKGMKQKINKLAMQIESLPLNQIKTQMETPRQPSIELKPLASRTEMEAFEENLKNVNFKKNVVDWLNWRITDIRSNNRMVQTLDFLFDRHFALNVRWTNVRGKKIALHQFPNILDIFQIIGTTQLETATAEKVKTLLMKRLKYAKDRQYGYKAICHTKKRQSKTREQKAATAK